MTRLTAQRQARAVAYARRVIARVESGGADWRLVSHECGEIFDMDDVAAVFALAARTPDAATVERLTAEIDRLKALLNTPETQDFLRGVTIEAPHQRERWGSDHDAGKTPFDWFWLVGYLAQKAADAAVRGDAEKAKHHTISTAAALANWHLALDGGDNRMRPGIEPPSSRAALSSATSARGE